MEVKTAFAIIIGLLMMVMIIIAGVVLMSSLTVVNVYDCTPGDYKAGHGTDFTGEDCGVSGVQLKCKASTNGQPDKCLDTARWLCCPLGQNSVGKFIEQDGQCCFIKKV
jgi:hypothetical protein